MKLRSPRGRREGRERKEHPRRARNPRALRLQKAREERRKRRAELGGEEEGAQEFVGVTLRAGDIAAAVVLFAGLLLIALPQHGGTILRLVLVALAATAALHALTAIVPEGSVTGWWRSPFERGAADALARPSGEIARMRAKMTGRRQRIRGGRPLPPETVRTLQPLIAVALERAGIDPGDPSQRQAVRRRVSPLTWAVLNSDPLYLPRWYETRAPDERQAADVVRRVLDDLERIAAGGPVERSEPASPQPRAR